jgi:hypothetical protein
MPITRRGSRNCSNGDNDNCEAEGSDVDRSYKSVPLGNAKGENISARRQGSAIVGVGAVQGLVLLSGRGSGLTSPSRTRDCCRRRSTNDKKRERLMRPTGRSCALMRAGAMKSIGERGSAAIATFVSGT